MKPDLAARVADLEWAHRQAAGTLERLDWALVGHGADTTNRARVRLCLDVRHACDQEVLSLGQPQAKTM